MKVAVLLSGGLDSTTALYWAHSHHEVVCALSFDYGSNHAARELACARYQAEKLGIPYHEIDLRSISAHLQSALLMAQTPYPRRIMQRTTSSKRWCRSATVFS